MEFLLLFARLLLTVVFFVAAIAKLFDLKASRKAVSDFGVSTWLANPIGVALPIAELLVATLLLPKMSSWWAAVGALVLLLVFIVAISVNIAQGRKPDCQCFGQIHSQPIGWPTLIRNGALALCAALIVSVGRDNPGLSGVAWLRALSRAEEVALVIAVVLVVTAVTEGWLLLHVIRQHGRVLLRMDALEQKLSAAAPAPNALPQAPNGLPIGAPAPSFELPTLNGDKLSLAVLCQHRTSVLLIFSDPNCGPCTVLLPDIARWQRDNADHLQIALVSRGAERANRTKAIANTLKNVLLQKDREVAQQYQANGTPAAVLVRADGTIGSRVVMGSQAITELVAHLAGKARQLLLPGASANGNGHRKEFPALNVGAGLSIGEPAPPFSLPDLTGRPVDLAGFAGKKILLLFWNPTCGFCSQMLPDLKAWEGGRPNEAPQLLVVSTGTIDARAMGLKSAVILDKDFGVGQRFGANGTPSAVLIDADGRIASELAVGAPGVLALAGAGLAKHLAQNQPQSAKSGSAA